jgi:hypothetical protein
MRAIRSDPLAPCVGFSVLGFTRAAARIGQAELESQPPPLDRVRL